MKYSFKILILVPGSKARGGIASYYQSLKAYFPDNILYLQRGSRNWPKRNNIILEFIRAAIDLFKFVYILLKENIDLVQTNTSFSSNAVFRDGLYLLISKLINKKVVVFFHGWDYNFVNKLNRFYKKLFKLLFFNSDAIIDLTKDNKSNLIEWGYTKNIYLETTAVADNFMNAANYEIIQNKYNSPIDKINLLFLARLDKEKGLYEAINVFNLLNKSDRRFKLIIAGDGNEFDNAREYVLVNKIDGIEFLGYVDGEVKLKTYQNSHIYLFPSYSEGMPTSVLEAMACGLPILTTRVGGLVDFFQEGNNGYFIDRNNLLDIKERIISLSNDERHLGEISKYNYNYARQNFSAKKVASRIISIFEEILKNKEY